MVGWGWWFFWPPVALIVVWLVQFSPPRLKLRSMGNCVPLSQLLHKDCMLGCQMFPDLNALLLVQIVLLSARNSISVVFEGIVYFSGVVGWGCLKFFLEGSLLFFSSSY